MPADLIKETFSSETASVLSRSVPGQALFKKNFFSFIFNYLQKASLPL